ncbi:MAG TPA: WhiB family transcriptional regulator [Acidimicrobiales bacterium]|nr:WhiB family transcriptional regulator [Acidimicrobiales bacterium]
MTNAIYATGPTSPTTALADALGLAHPPWHADALCVEYPEVNFFPEKGEAEVVRAAQAVCRRCLAREECLAFAMSDSSIVGVWGGTTRSQRVAMRKGRRAGAPGWLGPVAPPRHRRAQVVDHQR